MNRLAGQPVRRLELAGVDGLPVGTIKGGGLRRDVAARLVAQGDAEIRGDRAFANQSSFLRGSDVVTPLISPSGG